MIAAIVLGVMALGALWFAFGGNLFGSKKITVTSASPTPKPSVSPNAARENLSMPTEDELTRIYGSTPIIHTPQNFSAPAAGRNIFAFYEPPPPTPPLPPTPPIMTPVPPPPPTPTPPQSISFIQPQSVYAGSKGFRMEVNGTNFTPETRIYFNGNEMPTTFVNEQKLVTDIPANFIASEGQAQIMVRTPDGKLYSLSVGMVVQAPPRPAMQYVGMIGRKGYNNDTAVFRETGKPVEFSARLNDVIGGRFRIFSISPNETVVEDVNLGFRHRMPLFRPAPGQGTSGTGAGVGGGNPADGRFPPNQGFPPPGTIYNPNNPGVPMQNIPGIPNDIPRYVPPQTPQPDAKDDIDDGDGN